MDNEAPRVPHFKVTRSWSTDTDRPDTHDINVAYAVKTEVLEIHRTSRFPRRISVSSHQSGYRPQFFMRTCIAY